MSSRPLAALNKSVHNLQGQAGPSSSSLTRSEAIAENLAILGRNTVRQSMRDDPNYIEAVADDEPMLNVDDFGDSPPSPHITPNNSRPSSPDLHVRGVAGVMKEILKLTPRSKKGIVALLNASDEVIPTTTSLDTKILYSSADERVIESRIHASFRIHPDLVALGIAKQHIPLSMFTSSSTERLWRDSASLKTKKINLASGAKITVVDTSQFQNEDDIDMFQFHETYQNLLEFHKEHGDHKFFERSAAHYRSLSSQKHFGKNFCAIKLFDKEQRQNAAYDPMVFDETQYTERFTEIKAEVFRLEQEEKLDRLLKIGPSRTDSSSSRYFPYPTPSSSRPSDQRCPFQGGKSDGAGVGTCLICGRPEHRFSACTYITTSKGGPIASKWHDKKFTTRTTNLPICINFNLRGPSSCNHDHSSHHICSLCGSPDHHTASRSCL